MTEAAQKEKVNSQGATAKDMAASQTETVTGIPKEPQDRKAPEVKKVEEQSTGTETKAVEQTTAETQQQTQTQTTEAKVTDWPEFNDTALKASSNVIKEAGLSYSDTKAIFAKVVETGKLEDVDLPALEAKIGKDKAALAMMGIKDYYTRQVAQANETIKAVHTVFGSEEAYNKAKAWATEKAKTDQSFASDLNKYREMFNSGGVSARAAARDLFQQYNSDPSTSGVKTKMVAGDKTVGVGASETPLTRSDYLPLYKAAHKKGDRAEMARLDARRRAGLKSKI